MTISVTLIFVGLHNIKHGPPVFLIVPLKAVLVPESLVLSKNYPLVEYVYDHEVGVWISG